MVWNIIDETKFTANNINLPGLSTKRYFQYGVGAQKKWGDSFSGYLQAMMRNEGRTGVAFNAGIRWTFGNN